MNKYFIKSLVIYIVLSLANASVFAGSRDEQVANVTVYSHTLNGKTSYTYTIQNTGIGLLSASLLVLIITLERAN